MAKFWAGLATGIAGGVALVMVIASAVDRSRKAGGEQACPGAAHRVVDDSKQAARPFARQRRRQFEVAPGCRVDPHGGPLGGAPRRR